MSNLADDMTMEKSVAGLAAFADGVLEAANINPTTGLATDYLNHYNEIIMLIEMVPEMPDVIEDCMAWEPASYQEHFARSVFSERDLAIAAFEATSPQIRDAFNALKGEIDDMILDAQAMLAGVQPGDALDPAMMFELTTLLSARIRPSIDRVSGLIHGLDMPEADSATVAAAAAQNTVDALFS
ncbi:MAG: hypothetical protein KDI98_01345 [Hyphomicrobiaceae bacterium]|nr:hypothetical protein [Hyphomicrobiaceae bacterium]